MVFDRISVSFLSMSVFADVHKRLCKNEFNTETRLFPLCLKWCGVSQEYNCDEKFNLISYSFTLHQNILKCSSSSLQRENGPLRIINAMFSKNMLVHCQFVYFGQFHRHIRTNRRMQTLAWSMKNSIQNVFI